MTTTDSLMCSPLGLTQRLSEPDPPSTGTIVKMSANGSAAAADLINHRYRPRVTEQPSRMLKASPPDRLVDAIEVVASGEALLAPSLTQRLIAE